MLDKGENMLSISEIRDYKSKGYKRIPILKSYYSDELTPIMVIKKIKAKYDETFLLESASPDQTTGRYSFIGYSPSQTLTSCDGLVELHNGISVQQEDDPINALRKLIASNRAPQIEGYPPLSGGVVGYFSYEFLQYSKAFEFTSSNPTQLPDMELMVFDDIICFDHYYNQVYLIANMDLEDDIEVQYQASLDRINQMYRLIYSEPPTISTTGQLTSAIEPRFAKDEFEGMVEQVKAYINQGEVSQVVLSNSLEARFKGSLLDTYRVLRTVNPSPYMVYLSSSNLEIAGASPESLGRLQNGLVQSFPLAGTIKRGNTKLEDTQLEEQLLTDPKEIHEHDLLVQTALNDIEEVCDRDTVQVASYKNIKKYSHVMHIESEVVGQIGEDKDAIDIIQALLPAGTLSGEPKQRAVEIIQELEGDRRDIYGGAIGYIDFAGNMDTCIAIRLVFKRDGKITIRSGAGIVSESNPEKEFQETLNKAKGTLVAVEKQNDIF